MYGAKKGHMGPLEERDAIVSIASSLTDHFPHGWKYTIYSVMFMGAYGIRQVNVENSNGELNRIQVPTSFVLNSMELRAGMYKENEGTWFSWELTIWSEGRFRSSFNYDDLPPFGIEPGLVEYLREVRLFPRSEEFTPDWLREKIDEAGRG